MATPAITSAVATDLVMSTGRAEGLLQPLRSQLSEQERPDEDDRVAHAGDSRHDCGVGAAHGIDDQEGTYSREEPVNEIPEAVLGLIAARLLENLFAPASRYQHRHRPDEGSHGEPDIGTDKIRLVIGEFLQHIGQSEDARSQQHRRQQLTQRQPLGEEHDKAAGAHDGEADQLQARHLFAEQPIADRGRRDRRESSHDGQRLGGFAPLQRQVIKEGRHQVGHAGGKGNARHLPGRLVIAEKDKNDTENADRSSQKT